MGAWQGQGFSLFQMVYFVDGEALADGLGIVGEQMPLLIIVDALGFGRTASESFEQKLMLRLCDSPQETNF